MQPSDRELSIGVFARKSRFSMRALRLYEQIGVLKPAGWSRLQLAYLTVGDDEVRDAMKGVRDWQRALGHQVRFALRWQRQRGRRWSMD